MHAPALQRSRRVGDAAIADRLRRAIEGEVLWSAADRGRYATDASIYQVEPIGVVVPRSTEDVAATLAIARDAGVPVLPRGGGTSQCGQTVNEAIVLDCTKHLRRVIGTEGDTVTVEPGIVLSHLNAAVKASGKFFPVDPSTHLRCTIGGMAGNNSCGSKSIRYGMMEDNVVAIEALLADGTKARFAEISQAPGPLLEALRGIGDAHAVEIAEHFPKQLRRVGGYNINALTPDARQMGRGNLARLLVGAEGTLAFSTAPHAEAVADQAAQGSGHLRVRHLPRGDGGRAASCDARPRGGGAGGCHHDRAGAEHSHLSRHDRRHGAGRAGRAADRGVPRS